MVTTGCTEVAGASAVSLLCQTGPFAANCRAQAATARFICAVIFALILGGAVNMAYAGNQPWDQAGLSADPKAMLQAAQAVQDQKGDVTVLLDERRFSIDEQGRVTRSMKLVFRVNTPDGVEEWSSTGTVWQPWYQEHPKVTARVIRTDGSVHMLDPKNMTDSPVDEDSPQIYSDDRRYHGPLPGVEVGAVVEEEILLRDLAPYFEGGISRREYFGRSVPVQQARFFIEAPLSLPLHYAVHSLPKAVTKKEEADGKMRVTVDIGPFEAMRNEHTNLPTDVATWPHVDFSTGKSWKDLSDAYRTAVEAQIRVEDVKPALPAMGSKAERDEIIRAIVAKLHKEIRYTGVEFGRSKLVPQTTAEILKRKFGDCKDKATLLVSMLRAKGIPAHLALLVSSDNLEDIEPEMPGMGLFDHVIVVVPGTPDLWIDATAAYTPVGALPAMDQGRAALVIREGTNALVRIPEMKSSDNVSIETREFFLAETGPARVVEISEPAGELAASLRRQYSGKLSEESRKELEDYMQSVYLAEKLTSVEAGDGLDLSRPYRMKLEAAKAKRGSTDQQSSVVAVPVAHIFSRLPIALRSEQEEDSNEKKAEAGREQAKPRTEDFVLDEAFTQEWRYHIVPPPGFQLHGLPEDQTVSIGPAKLTRSFKSEPDKTVTAVFRFDSVKRRFTAEEAKQIRTAVLKTQNSPVLVISFDQSGYALIAAGKIREGLAAYRSLVALHPREGLHRAQLADGLLKAGLGENARAEAREATKLDPTSAPAFKTLGWILQHDLIGRRFGRGFERKDAIAAYRKAKELDPKDSLIRAELAILLEYDDEGERYTSEAPLTEAVQEYQELRAKDKDDNDYDDNLAFALVYAEKFKEAKALISEIGHGTTARRALLLAATAADDGAEAAIKRSADISSNEDDRAQAAYVAGQVLMNMRRYPLAVEMMQAGLSGQANAPQLLGLVEALRRTRRVEELAAPADPAQAVVHTFMIRLFTAGHARELLNMASRNALNDGKTEEDHLKEIDKQQRSIRTPMKGLDIPIRVLADVAMSNMQLSSEKGPGGIHRVILQAIGAKTQRFVVVEENGAFKLLGAGADSEIGREVLDRAAKGDLPAARMLLDWAREETSIGGGDDEFAGRVFPRFWAKAQAGEKDMIEYAAASMLVDAEEKAPNAIEILKRGYAAAVTPAEKTRFDLALAHEYTKEQKWNELKETAARLVVASPQSASAFSALTAAYGGLHDWASWDKAVQERLARIPNDAVAERSAERAAVMQNQFEKARSILKTMIDAGRATSGDMNEYAWNALFVPAVTPEDVQMAQRALSMEKNSEFNIMHTLACLLARADKPKEARELLMQGMKVAGYDEPDTAVWLALGLIAEQYGEYEAARAAYARGEKPKGEASPISSYALMQLRVKAIGDQQPTPAATATGK